jgi:hypothetical protein
MEDLYSNEFYAGQIGGSERSAEHILNLIFESYKPTSVLDAGCGTGAWLRAAKKLGVDSVHGIDGVWAKKFFDKSDGIIFTAQDLETLQQVDGKYGLCISLEVAEHISEVHADQFVKAVCSASDVVLFGAAIKFQGGKNHINEQRQSYWVKKFEDNNYQCLDYIRPSIWDEDDVDCWYRQNTFLFVHESISSSVFAALEKRCSPIYDIVHPAVLQVKMKRFDSLINEPRVRDVLRLVKNLLASKFS